MDNLRGAAFVVSLISYSLRGGRGEGRTIPDSIGQRCLRPAKTSIQGDNFGLLHGWVDFVLVVALSAWKGGNQAEQAQQLDTMVEHPNQSHPNHVTNQSCHPV